MSFMFNPFPFDDMTCVNRPHLDKTVTDPIIRGNLPWVRQVCRHVEAFFSSIPEANSYLIGLDGYVGAEWDKVVDLLSGEMGAAGFNFEARPFSGYYHTPEALNRMLAGYLPEDREADPVLLFGKLFEEGLERVIVDEKLRSLQAELADQSASEAGPKRVLVLYGCGTLLGKLRKFYDLKLFFDVTPKEAILRIRNGRYRNLGDEEARPFREMMRRCYYFDFEITGRLRRELLAEGDLDYYVASDNAEDPLFVPRDSFNEICSSLANYPFRCKPVYNEGVWGGHFLSRMRNLPDTMRNCAWIFDLIPLEVSLLIEAGAHLLEIPFFTFVQKEGEALMGEACVRKFGGYFPIRFNYDDTWHSSGNMSIQVHPPEDFSVETFGEFGAQHESYYVVATGHGSKTYLGFKEGPAYGEFKEAVLKSEQSGSPVDYTQYVHAVETRPGTQVMIPAGTIHASGQNQVVLEIGSLTVGSYTFKLYDYLRTDLDGKPRPIHSDYGFRVLCPDRDAPWVEDNLVRPAKLISEGDGWRESLVGEHDSIYFTLKLLEFDSEITGDTKGLFQVLTLVDGERVRIESLGNPGYSFIQNYLDIVVVPAGFGPYRIVNMGAQPVVVHKTHVKESYLNA